MFLHNRRQEHHLNSCNLTKPEEMQIWNRMRVRPVEALTCALPLKECFQNRIQQHKILYSNRHSALRPLEKHVYTSLSQHLLLHCSEYLLLNSEIQNDKYLWALYYVANPILYTPLWSILSFLSFLHIWTKHEKSTFLHSEKKQNDQNCSFRQNENSDFKC